MNQFLLEKQTMLSVEPVDLNTAGITGPRLKMDKSYRLAIVLAVGASLASTVSVALKQHNAATAGTTKALEITNKYFIKADVATVFTQVEPTVAEDTYDVSAQLSTAKGVLVLEVLAEDLDVDNGFAWVSADVADSGAAKIGHLVYMLHEVKNSPAYEIAL